MAVRQTDVLIEQAQQAKRMNDAARARSLLSQAIKSDPRNEEAWMLFADVADKKEHAIYSLEQVLKLNPVNMEALDRLNALKAPSVPLVTTPPTLRSTSTIARQTVPVQAAPSAPRTAERETTIVEERMHGAVFMVPFLMAVVAIALNVFIGFLPGWSSFGLLISVIFIVAAILEFLRASVRFATSRLTLTNKRIIIKRGLLDRHTFEVLLTKVEGIGVKQPLIGRMFGFGTIIVTGTGGAHQVFRGLRDPQGFRERVQQEIATMQARG